jgi:beta-phosphoglucomutase-like phosphatase (HAD superfamily)
MLPIPPGTAALLFDCDGTLADTMTLHYDAWYETLVPYGVDCPRSFIDTHAGVPTHGIVGEVNKLWGVTLDGDTITAEKEARFAERIHLAKPIDEVLGTAHAYQDMVHAILETIGAVDLFPVIITANDPVAPKPSPDVFLEAARRLNVPANKCHVFEDGDPGIIAAERAGMTYTDVRLVLQAKAS